MPENLVFAGTPLIAQPLGLVFGDGSPDPNARITDLVFTQPPRVHPNRLVFGDSDTSTHPDSMLEVSGALPELVARLHLVIGVPVALQAALPDLVGTVAVKYQSQTQRPMVAQVQTWSQVSTLTESGLTQPQQHAQATNAGAQDHAQTAASEHFGVSPGYVEAIRSSREVGSSFQDGCATWSRLHANWADGLADRRVNGTSPFQEGRRGPTVRAVGRFQDGLHDRRAWLENSWAGAIPRNKGYTGHAGAAIPLRRFLPSAFEEASDPLRRAHPYVCPAGYWTIGWGHLCPPDHPPVTEAEAVNYLTADLEVALAATLRYCPVLQNQPENRFAAIVDFTFNLGAGRLQTSTLRRRINQMDWAGATLELRKWVHGGGRVLPGLVARRQAEIALMSQSI